MTGFATRRGAADQVGWTWDLRSVNSKGLDLRLRLPDGAEGLEPELRKRVGAQLKRGAVQIALRTRLEAGAGGVRLDTDLAEALLAAASDLEDRAGAMGLPLAPSTSAGLLALEGMVTRDVPPGSDWQSAALADFDAALDDLARARAAEGVEIAAVLDRALSEVERLVTAAAESAEARNARTGQVMRARLAALIESTDRIDEDRFAQELATVAIKADVTEEIDRLNAHVRAARDLLSADGPVGRKLDFLMQEFNREANTLCAKAQDSTLTAIGLDLKVVVDQMREQVQNVE
ncbi:YicC family protein [Rhodobacteraceae bacterium KN286]|uniref:YicC family protein n=2 Tax=Oceanomicrobium pacificus TaxID=2692916 RepID=A0A6B0TXE2_9RHOB|nr:YicC family protein [Oceanomicrobium pacificus]